MNNGSHTANVRSAGLGGAPITVVHRPRDAAGHGMPGAVAATLAKRGFYAATCMREVAVLPATATLHDLPRDTSTAILVGADAYAFLLQTTTGLNSSVPGETNVQGQLRKAWRSYSETADMHQAAALSPVMQSLFDDAALVRQRYLEGIGGNSYGSLVRKLLRPGADDRILIVGAGDLAASVLPFFSNNATGVWNRHLPEPDFAPATQRFADRAAAIRWATQVVMTTPPETDHDCVWAGLCLATGIPVAHLGRRRAARGDWAHLPEFFDLDDIFDLRRSQSSLRSLQLVRARAACEQIANEHYIYPPTATLHTLTAASA
ncbi:MAG: hypothetical protein HKN56_04825 [Gammaproteobacteria bacterium]|nr:hypothetical protein [Gammaproteobacteria bacterium]